MGKSFVLAMTLVALFWTGTGNSARLIPVVSAQTAQPEFIDRFVGSWMLKVGFMGPTSAGMAHFHEPTVIKRDGNKVTFDVRLPVRQGSYGAPVDEDFKFILEQTTETEYALSVESKSWLNVTQLKLSLADGALTGKTVIPFDGGTAPLDVTIRPVQDGGHTWALSLRRGKTHRSFELMFTPALNKS